MAEPGGDGRSRLAVAAPHHLRPGAEGIESLEFDRLAGRELRGVRDAGAVGGIDAALIESLVLRFGWEGDPDVRGHGI